VAVPIVNISFKYLMYTC